MAVYKLTSKNRKKHLDYRKNVGIILLAVSSLCFLFLATNLIPFLHKFLVGLVGYAGIPFCIISFVVGLALLNKRRYVMPIRYAIYLGVVVLCVLCILQIALIGDKNGLSFWQYLGKNYTAKINPAGLLVGIITTPIIYLTTIWGAYTIFSALLALFIGLFIDCINQLKKSSQMSAPLKVQMNSTKDEPKPEVVKKHHKVDENINIVLDAKIQEDIERENKARKMLGLLGTMEVEDKKEEIKEEPPKKLEGDDLRKFLLTPPPPKIEVTDFIKQNTKPIENSNNAPILNGEISSNINSLKKEEIQPSQIIHEYEFMADNTPVIKRNSLPKDEENNSVVNASSSNSNFVNDIDDDNDENEDIIQNKNKEELNVVQEADNILKEVILEERRNSPSKFVELDNEEDDLQKKIDGFVTNRLDRNYKDNIQKTIDKTLNDDRRGSAIDNRSKVLDIRDDRSSTLNTVRRNFIDLEDETNPFNRKKDESKESNNILRRNPLSRNIINTPSESEIIDEDNEVYDYMKPPIDLITTESVDLSTLNEDVATKRVLLEDSLENFGVPAKVQSVVVGPAVTRYELEMPSGISVSKIKNRTDDIALALAAEGSIRIEAPIPGRSVVGVEVPNNRIATVSLKDILLSNEFRNNPAPLTFALGKDITGKIITCDMQKLTHLLVAGTTGSGKSVCLNSIILSIVYKCSPEDVKIMLVDPKKVEFSNYESLPHLIQPSIICDTQKAVNGLTWAVNEMERRFEILGENRVKNIDEYNHTKDVLNGDKKKLPYIVIIVDELADLMMTGKKEVEEKIVRLAQKARAAGIHLILATQRPSVDVITGLIKTNIPSRISFSVVSSVDSMTILDRVGAEKLLGKGDMLYSPVGSQEPKRIQACFVSTPEINSIVDYVKDNNRPIFDKTIQEAINNPNKSNGGADDRMNEMDPLLPQVLKVSIETGQASTTMIRRKFAIGYPRAARIIDQMEAAGYISSGDGVKGRTVYTTMEEYNEIFGDQD